ncbi:phosphonate metabolism protein/1,5-bisphosphokinase (PRPP-forming) PhnN [Pseudomonas sp. MWU16-30317]|uniref:phosphonate metabolism protein/1,5-bisphosphokinase (PRPP-forming) PhnN n=1 Tax=Pseudomonas sp. MWU16-30317 TaxID=2878095 RepID=UPI001CFB81FB|nr:phosphonate metabolism protein/1,5-bisphosphokinase (PRPP-forming) PhnN [Pseudomonas sp. MWU16-30317]
MQARLIYLMGPSGAGKDSVIDAARGRLATIPVDVVRRVITRSAESIGEQALGVSDERFAAMQHAGDFAMNWRANGHDYGIPEDINLWLAQGRHVLINGSRDYLPEAQRRYPDLLPVLVSVSSDVLRQRLLLRGRESLEEIERRLQRNERLRTEAQQWQGRGAAQVLDNSGTLEQAVADLMALLSRHGISAAGGRT